MPSDAELDKTLQRGREVDAMWKEIEQQLQDFERDKDEFAREIGFGYEKFLSYMSNQAAQARSTADAETLAQMDRQSEQLKQQFENEVKDAQDRHDAGRRLEKSSGTKRARRMRNMI